MMRRHRAKRVLALDPTSNGFGYVVFEGPELLLDWGVARIPIADTARLLRRTLAIIEFYAPDIVVTEDANRPDPRRSPWSLRYVRKVPGLAGGHNVAVRCYARHDVRRAFAESGALTREEIARSIAARYPELGARLPPPRKLWMSEDIRMSMFDAASLAITYFRNKR